MTATVIDVMARSPFASGEALVLNCQNCTTKAVLQVDVARGLGWRIFDGVSVTKKPLTVRLCPACSGAASPDGDGTPRGFDAVCDTCDASMSEEWDGEEPEGGWSEKDAEDWMSDHQCEPFTHIVRPGTKEAAR